MWETIYSWVVSFFNYFRSNLSVDRDNFQRVITTQNEVITSMQSRIDTMDHEFRQAMERRDGELYRALTRIDALEISEEKCRKSLASAEERLRLVEEEAGRSLRAEQERNKSLRRKLNEAKKALAMVQKVKKMKEDPEFQANSLALTETLLDEKRANPPLAE